MAWCEAGPVNAAVPAQSRNPRGVVVVEVAMQVMACRDHGIEVRQARIAEFVVEAFDVDMSWLSIRTTVLIRT